MKLIFLSILAATSPAAAARAETPPKPLFADEQALQITIAGPISALARSAEARRAHEGLLTVVGGAQHQIRLTPRGITRLKPETCQFPPLRVEFNAPPPPGSPFAGQRRLKLVTHCRNAAGFQQYLLREYAAYRLYNQLTPDSFRVRLAHIDYVDGKRVPLRRIGFFIEEHRDMAERRGMRVPAIGDAVSASRLDPVAAARVALFQYFIGNLDWSTRAGPPGEGCCHNIRQLELAIGGALVPVPYDFDFSGLVDAPYATPPDIVPVRTVRSRYYRGFCRHNGEALALAREWRGRRAELLGVLAQVPGLDPGSRARAVSYLDGFFTDIATDNRVAAKLLRTCLEG